jgi:rhomboid family GlyGly-CTERM serine protease
LKGDLEKTDQGSGSGIARAGVPWATALVAILALVIHLVPAFGEALIYNRALIFRGEWWRVFMGNWVHFGGSHLFWNLAVLVPAGIWLERVSRRRARALFVLAPVVIGLALFALDPTLSRYAGLSGVATGLLALLALTQLTLQPGDRWFWRAVLGLLALKITAEFLREQPFFARFADEGMRAVPLAHLAGALCGCWLHFRRRRSPV